MLCLALERLKITDEELWNNISIECKKTKHNFTPFGYA
jgi:hypothetical protein